MMNGRKHHPSQPASVGYVPCSKLLIEEWFLNDLRHRLDGPAVIHSDGHKEWWVNGEKVRVELSPAEIDRIRHNKFLERQKRLHRTCPVTWETYGSNLNQNSWLIQFLKWFNDNVHDIKFNNRVNNKYINNPNYQKFHRKNKR